MANPDEPRIYGMPDPTNRQPPGEEGFRGEEGAQRRGRPELAHAETGPDGKPIVIEEESGTAFAEVTGRAGGEDEPTAPPKDE